METQSWAPCEVKGSEISFKPHTYRTRSLNPRMPLGTLNPFTCLSWQHAPFAAMRCECQSRTHQEVEASGVWRCHGDCVSLHDTTSEGSKASPPSYNDLKPVLLPHLLLMDNRLHELNATGYSTAMTPLEFL